MLSYIRIGANDIPLSGRFYTAILTPLGYRKKEVPDGIEFTFPDVPGQSRGPPRGVPGKTIRRKGGDRWQRLYDGLRSRDE
ncbi:MAG: hypothetical protein AAFR75_04160 [Pseudomonadota bacterium]